MKKIHAEHTNEEGLQLGGSGEKIGFFGKTPIERPSQTLATSVTFTTNDPGYVTSGSVNVADGENPTPSELLQISLELSAEIDLLRSSLQTLGLQTAL